MAAHPPAVLAARKEMRVLLKRADYSFDLYLQSLLKSRDGRIHGRLFRQHMKCCLEAEQLAPAARIAITSSHTFALRRQAHLKSLSPKKRAKLAPHLKAGLSGRARQRWIDDGTTLAEQIEEDRLAGRTTEFTYVPPPPPPRVSVDEVLPDALEDPEFPGRSSQRNVATRSGNRFTAAQVAAKLGVEPVVVRRVARKLSLDVRAGFTLDEAKAIKKGLK